MNKENIDLVIDTLVQNIGERSTVSVRRFYIGKTTPIDSAIIYMDGLADKTVINRDILSPLMHQIDDNISNIHNISEYLCKMHIACSSTIVENDFQKAVTAVKNGNTVLILDKEPDFIIIDTVGGVFRQISDPSNESSISGPRDSFIEDIHTNISLIRRRINDNNLVVENFTVGVRSQTSLVLMYIDNIADNNVLSKLRKKIKSINVEFVTSVGMVSQLISEKNYPLFPNMFNTERPDRAVANIMEGKIAIILDGSATVLTAPTLVWEFLSTVEDYYNSTLVANVQRMLRMLAIIITLFISGLYLVVVQFDSELIPINFVVPIVQSRAGMPLTPFMEILVMEILIEFLREGGLRLPSKIAQTLSIVGGIIIGDAAVQSKIVSPTTLLVVGIAVVASFLIPNNNMSVHIRLLKILILVLANFLGLLSISVGLIIILVYLCSAENFGVPYMTFYRSDLKDIFVRAPLNQMTSRPQGIPNKKSAKRTFKNTSRRK